MAAKIKHLLFDAANTLIHKPQLWIKIQEVLKESGYNITDEKLMYNHKLISELINFPDRTNKDFYHHFNSELLLSLGINPNDKMLNLLFEKCSYLPWESFADCGELKSIDLPKSILSNFNSTLSNTISEKVNLQFNTIINSEIEGVRKPNIEFYNLAVSKLNCAANEILYIGDSLNLDYCPAKEVGMNSLVIDRINFFPKHDFIINSFSEIKTHLA
ncbi:MAG: HAD-IA family hydrolase [Bacteroidota bacterium]